MSYLAIKIRSRLSTRALYGIALFVIFSIALALRISLPYETIFTGDGVRFIGNDSWFYMRLMDNLAHNFPHGILFDPYALYPGGSTIGIPPFFLMLLGSTTWVIGLGSPSEYVIETVGAYFPAILGAMVTIPVYFIGKEIFNRNVGLLCAALIAILPGQFLFRSLLGFTDHHIAEVLFSTTAALFLILAIKRAKENEISFSHIRNRDWGYLMKPLIYALLAGLALGIYLLSWIGALLFVFLIFAYLVIQYIIDHLRGKSTDYLFIIGVPIFLISVIMVVPFSDMANLGKLGIPSLAIAVVVLLVLSGVSWLMSRRNIKRAYYPVALVCLGLAGAGILYAIDPDMFRSMVDTFGKVFLPSATQQTVGEARSLVSLSGFFKLFTFFTLNIILALVALGLLIYAEIKGRSFDRTLTFLIIWTLIMLAAMLGQERFAYYFAVNVALLSGYLCFRMLKGSWGYFEQALPEVKKGQELKKTVRGQISSTYARVASVTVILFFIAFAPNIAIAIQNANDLLVPNNAWYSSLVWMREYTPDPFEDPDFYYALYEKPPAGEEYDYPDSAYGVMSSWDYGYWITRIARRIPNASPSGQANAREAAEFFTAQDESVANEMLDDMGSQYVITDYSMSYAKFSTIGISAGESEWQFLEIYYEKAANGLLEPLVLYYPAYYQSICSRLYNFNGEAVVPLNSTMVISYKDITYLGRPHKEITSTQTFATYEEAQEYLDSHPVPNYRIVGDSPFVSPVPLEELDHYKLVHQSEPEVIEEYEHLFSYVKIFEYLP